MRGYVSEFPSSVVKHWRRSLEKGSDAKSKIIPIEGSENLHDLIFTASLAMAGQLYNK
jgi:hypothetical protein